MSRPTLALCAKTPRGSFRHRDPTRRMGKKVPSRSRIATDPGAQGPGGSRGDPHQPGQRQKKPAFPSSPAESCPSHPCWETGGGGGGPIQSKAGHRHLPGERFGGEGQRYPPVGPRERGLLEKAAAQLPRGRRQSWGVRKAKGHDGDRADPTGSAE